MAFKDFIRNTVLNVPGKSRKALESRGIKFEESAFVDCVREGKAEEVGLFLEAGMSSNARGADKLTAVQHAVSANRPAILKTLLLAGGDVSPRDPEGNSLVMLAITKGLEETGVLIAQSGFQVDARNNEGFSAVMLCARNNQPRIAEALINSGADVLGKNHVSGETPLVMSAMRGYFAMVELLLRNAITAEDRDATDKTGASSLLWAARNGHTDVVRLLCEKKANLNLADSAGRTPLSEAIAAGHSEIQKILTDAGAK